MTRRCQRDNTSLMVKHIVQVLLPLGLHRQQEMIQPPLSLLSLDTDDKTYADGAVMAVTLR